MPNIDDENPMNNIPEEPDKTNESTGGDFNFEDMSTLTGEGVDNIQRTDAEDKIHEETSHLQEHSGESTGDATITAQPVKFASFEDLDSAQGLANQNLGILLDVKLQLTVELGKTELPIKKVLELTKGSVVTLDKAAGEPVELYANGKLIAHGEVVVIEDNFGLRITHITQPIKRIDTFTHLPHETLQ